MNSIMHGFLLNFHAFHDDGLCWPCNRLRAALRILIAINYTNQFKLRSKCQPLTGPGGFTLATAASNMLSVSL